MTDTFISYKREEKPQARKLAEALQKHGFNVWWDADILPGEAYRAVTFEILQSCRAAIVIWSTKSVASSWVLDEAQRALDRGVLIPVNLEPLGAYPLGFGQLHTHDLTDWDGAPDHPALTPVLLALRRLVGQNKDAPVSAPNAAEVETEVAFWRGIHDSGDSEEFEAYLARYPNGMFADLARRRAAAAGASAKAQGIAREPTPRPAAEIPKPQVQTLLDASAPAGGLSRPQIGLLAACVFLAAFIAWPIANAALGLARLVYGEDYAFLLRFDTAQSVFIATPLLTGLAWLYDRGVSMWVARGRGGAIVRFGVLALLGLFFMISLGMRANEGRETQFAVWLLLTWTAVTFVRRLSDRLMPMIAAQRDRAGDMR